MQNVKNAIESYLKKYPLALDLFYQFMQIGNVFLIGGALREYKDKKCIEELRDADFVLDIDDFNEWEILLKKYRPEKNSFDGYKFWCGNFCIDVWEVKNTWAYREEKVLFNHENYVKTLPKTVFLNMDAIIYDFSHDEWYDTIYKEAKRTGLLDIVLEDNPYLHLNILRAIILKRKYKMSYSNKLKDIMLKEYFTNSELISDMMDIQEKRYHRKIISAEKIENEFQKMNNRSI